MNNPARTIDRIAAALDSGPFNVSRDVILSDGNTAEAAASRTYFSWKGLVILSQHILVRHVDHATQQDAKALFDAGFRYGKKVNRVPLLRGMQFGYMIIPVIVGESPADALIQSASARMVMSGAGYIMPGLAGGVLSIGYTHVDAHEAAAAWISAVELMKEKGWTVEETADYVAKGIRSKEKDDAFARRFGEKRVIPGWHHPQHIRDLRSPRIIEVAERLGVAGEHVEFIVALEKATEKYWGRTLYMNVAGAISATLLDMGFNPDECLAFCAIARSVSITAHCVEEKTREKGWRASTSSKITQPLDLALQGPDYYDGPEDRNLPEERIDQPLERAPYHYQG